MPFVILEIGQSGPSVWLRVCLPFLRSVDYIVLAVRALDRSCGDVRDITTGLGLCDRDTGALLAGKKIREEPLLQVLTAKLDNWGDTKCKSSIERATGAT